MMASDPPIPLLAAIYDALAERHSVEMARAFADVLPGALGMDEAELHAEWLAYRVREATEAQPHWFCEACNCPTEVGERFCSNRCALECGNEVEPA